MKTSQSSTTALGIAAARAFESEKPAGERICDDPYARRFINPLFYQIMRFFIVTGYAERSGPGVLGYLAARCRHIDEFLLQMSGEGLEQLVILGAGFDSRAYRYADRLEQVKVFEVDHPATQAAKLDKMRRIFEQAPAHVTYVAVDFNSQALDRRLFEFGYDPRRKTLFIWEGVTMYLTLEAVDATLAFLRCSSGPGSAVIFDYTDQSLLEEARHGEVRRMRRYSRITGEGLTFGIPDGTITAFLERRGFTRVEDTRAGDLKRLYFTGTNSDRRVAGGYGIVSAVVR